ncbi:glycine-rich RNA-binding protein 1-like [Vitis vinifera]|uniref:glycine-rich RNA-binding protein 1-like n=1 Tax=Vitis vinifera TaxID=29760 RepID=UPI00288338B9|nr:glycine-rich RNA-binding protein 1-like [Vitis vinifera]
MEIARGFGLVLVLAIAFSSPLVDGLKGDEHGVTHFNTTSIPNLSHQNHKFVGDGQGSNTTSSKEVATNSNMNHGGKGGGGGGGSGGGGGGGGANSGGGGGGGGAGDKGKV